MKTCTKCKINYPEPLEDAFNKKRGTKDGYQHKCKKCFAEFHKEHYAENKSYYKKKAAKHNRIYNKRNLLFIIDFLKSHPCIDCGEDDYIVLEFDHKYNKNYNVSAMHTLSLDRIKEEIDKCEIRCANCHRRKTAIQLGWYKILERDPQ